MTITISISHFRQDLSNYLDFIKEGNTIVLKDEKRNEKVAEITPKKKFDPEAFGRTLKKVAGTFTAENHPEWKTKRDVIRWVEEGRAAADRTF